MVDPPKSSRRRRRSTAGAVVERMLAKDPDNAGWQADLAARYNRVGDVLRSTKDYDGAIGQYADALAIVEKWALRTGQAGWLRMEAYYHAKLAAVLRDKGDAGEADEYESESAAIYAECGETKSDFFRAACSYGMLGERDKAFAMLDKAIELGLSDVDEPEQREELAPLRVDSRWEPMIKKLRSAKGK